jgi:RNA polymerase sigma-70 factor (ECF subfamily)
MPAPRPADSRALLEHASWVRALAHRLVADQALADDLAQDTCVAALEHPPAAAVHARGWLRAVLANFARQAGRGGARRRVREALAARPEAEAGALEVLARAAAHRELVDAVMALPEPFRTAILLRFFDELPPRRIARELGVPVATVHSRVQRGLAQLRVRLDERSRGDRGAWVSALLPLARELGPSFPLSMGALAM